MTGMRSLFVLAMLSAHGRRRGRQRGATGDAGAAPARGGSGWRRLAALHRVFSAASGRSVAQSAATPGGTDTPPPAGTFAPVWDWLARSSQAYDDVVIAQLKNPDGWTVIVQRAVMQRRHRRPRCPPRRKSRRPRTARMERPRRDDARLAGARQPLVPQRDRQAAARADAARDARPRSCSSR